MMDPIILHYGKGQLTGFLVDPNGVLDVVSIFCSSYQSSQNAQVSSSFKSSYLRYRYLLTWL